MTESRTCTDPEVGRLLAAYELGQLLPQERVALEEHLRSCAACLDELHEMARYTSPLVAPGGALAPTHVPEEQAGAIATPERVVEHDGPAAQSSLARRP